MKPEKFQSLVVSDFAASDELAEWVDEQVIPVCEKLKAEQWGVRKTNPTIPKGKESVITLVELPCDCDFRDENHIIKNSMISEDRATLCFIAKQIMGRVWLDSLTESVEIGDLKSSWESWTGYDFCMLQIKDTVTVADVAHPQFNDETAFSIIYESTSRVAAAVERKLYQQERMPNQVNCGKPFAISAIEFEVKREALSAELYSWLTLGYTQHPFNSKQEA